VRERLAIALAVVCACVAGAISAAEPAVRMLDDFGNASAWSAVASDQVSASLRHTEGARGSSLCLDYDFHGVSGYAAMRRPLGIDYPADYEFDFRVRGRGPDNALQFKLADAKNENVWWVNRTDFSAPPEWTKQRYKKRQISFAWGPIADQTLRRSESVEFTVYAVNGGSGEVCFDGLVLRQRPPPPAIPPNPIAKASSAARDAPAANAVDGNPATFWQSASAGDAEQELTIDFGFEREFGGVVLHWRDGAFASRYDVELSDDAKRWHTARRVTDGNGGVDPLYMPESEARYIRFVLHGQKSPYALDEVEIKDLAFAASANAFFAELAKASPRGWYPRGFYDEQTYWTIVGIDGGHETGLFSEDGAFEVGRGGFSIAPFIVDENGGLISWADVAIEHSLKDGYLPIPSVVWRMPSLVLKTTAFASGTRDSSQLIANYTIENTADTPRQLTLALAIQPFQVNPAVQFLNTPGGVSPIHDLSLRADVVSVDGKPRVYPLTAPDDVFATAFDAGMAFEHIPRIAAAAHSTQHPNGTTTHDDTGLASGALLYRIALAPHTSQTIGLVVPLDGPAKPPKLASAALPSHWIADRENAAAAQWRETLDRVAIRVPPAAQPIVDTLRTALAHILISRDGAAIRPGTRSYARSWIRDGAMMSAALLRLGHADAARDYLEWYAPYQFKNGKVPCCVDARGSDPVSENDSHGELIYLAEEVYRYSGDRALLESMWPHVNSAVHYMDQLRADERTDTNLSGDRHAFYGLMPASISHEGYSAKPMHSYWDDFWALTGYKDAVEIAEALGKTDEASRVARSRDKFRDDLYASIRRAVANHGIDYLPGCAELGDFDATSTTIALSPAGEQANLPQDLLHNTFERYWNQFAQRRDDDKPWKDYTPYEWRTVASFVRLGWRERAQQAIDFFMHDRRPPEWNQWAEVVGRDPRESRFVGDMPHGWVASDFIRSALDLFAYERESDRSLVIAAGIPDAWLERDGVAVENLRTPYGSLTYSLKRGDEGMRLELRRGDLRVPPGGIVFAPPLIRAASIATINGKSAAWDGSELRIRTLPATVEITTVRHRQPSRNQSKPSAKIS
jgi:hypothetical protein